MIEWKALSINAPQVPCTREVEVHILPKKSPGILQCRVELLYDILTMSLFGIWVHI